MVQLTEHPAQLPKHSSGGAARTFVIDGFLHVPGVVPLNRVQAWADRFATSSFLSQLFDDLFERGHTKFPTHCRAIASSQDCNNSTSTNEACAKLETAALPSSHPSSTTGSVLSYALGQGIKHGFREVVMRSPGRYEISIVDTAVRHEIVAELSHQLPYVPSLLCDNQETNPLTWDTVQIINVSIVVSTPGAPAQAWHADGSHVDVHYHLPCHCLNIFVPLTPVTHTNGPTELRPASHYYTRDLTRLLLAAKARRTLRPTVAPTLKLGDCLVFDYRILHRGLANQECVELSAINEFSGNRTILVVAVAQPWFKDVVNFPKRSMYDSSDRDIATTTSIPALDSNTPNRPNL